MKTNKFLILLPILAAMLLTAGCAQSDKASESAVAEILAKTEPVPIPEGGWTEETILDVTYINGKPLKLPCAFDDLGEGFEYVPDEEADSRMQKFGFASYELKYNGVLVGTVGFSVESERVTGFTFNSRYDEKYPAVPISVNGVTMGSPVSDFEKYVAEDECPNDTTGDSKIHSNIGQYEHLYYDFAKTDNKVTVIWFHYFDDPQNADGSDNTNNN